MCASCAYSYRRVKLTEISSQIWVIYGYGILLDIEMSELWKPLLEKFSLTAWVRVLEFKRKTKMWRCLEFTRSVSNLQCELMQIVNSCSVAIETHWLHLVMKPENKTKGQNNSTWENMKEIKQELHGIGHPFLGIWNANT